MSGIESAVLNRTKLFQLANLPCTIVTSQYNPDLHANLEKWINEGRVANDVSLISIFDHLQNAIDFKGSGQFGFDEDTDFLKVSHIEGGQDSRLYDKAGNFAGYVKRRANRSIHYINYLSGGQVTRRETYDNRGFLSRVDQITRGEKSENILELYFRPDGTVALEKILEFSEGKITKQAFNLLDSTGRLSHKFDSMDGLMQHFLESLTKSYNGSIFIIDRSTEYFRPLMAAKNKRGSANFAVVPVIHNSHAGGDVFFGPVNGYYKEVFDDLNAIDALIVLSNAQKQDLQNRFSDTNIFVIPNSHAKVELAGERLARKSNQIVYMARYMPEKQHHIAVEVIEKVVAQLPEVKLLCYGFGTGKLELIDLVKAKGLEQSIEVNDYVLNVAELYQTSSLSILTSSVEGFCQGLLESLFYGCPAVAFDVKYGNSDMIQNGKNGFLIRPFDTEEFANRIVELLTDQDLLNRVTDYAPFSVERFSHETVAGVWRDFVSTFVAKFEATGSNRAA